MHDPLYNTANFNGSTCIVLRCLKTQPAHHLDARIANCLLSMGMHKRKEKDKLLETHCAADGLWAGLLVRARFDGVSASAAGAS